MVSRVPKKNYAFFKSIQQDLTLEHFRGGFFLNPYGYIVIDIPAISTLVSLIDEIMVSQWTNDLG